MRKLAVKGCLVLLAAAVFAGCVQAESTGAGPKGDAPGVASGPAEFDESTGGVEGTVTDTELQPLVGALIGILKSDVITEERTVVTDDVGHFSFSKVPPGEHTLAASALGYTAASKRVSVSVGAVTPVALALETLPIDEPRSFTEIRKGTVTAYMYRATPQCMYFSSYIPVQTQYNTLVKTCGGAGGATFGQLHWVEEFYPETEWKTIVGELDWQPQSAVTGKGFLMDINAPNITRGTGGSIDQASPYTWVQMQGKAPIIIRIDNPETLDERGIAEGDRYSYPDGTGCTNPGPNNCDWFLRLFGAYCDLSSNFGDCYFTPVDFGLPQSLPVTLYFSYFYKEGAEPAFTALPDR